MTMLAWGLLTLTFVTHASAIFEDQIGKFDWRQRYVGCPHQLDLEQPKGAKPGLLLVATDANMIGAVKVSTGKIAWRQQLENSSGAPISFTIYNKVLITVTKDDRIVRAWERDTGVLIWQTQILPQLERYSQVLIAESTVFVIRRKHIAALTLSNGKIIWERNIDDEKQWIGAVEGAKTITVFGGVQGSYVTATQLNPSTGEVISKESTDVMYNDRCVLSQSSLLCYDQTTVCAIKSLPGSVEVTKFDIKSMIIDILSFKKRYFAIHTSDSAIIFCTNIPHKLTPVLTIPKIDKGILAMSLFTALDGRAFLTTAISNDLNVYDIVCEESAKVPLVFSGQLKADAIIKQIAMIGSSREFEFVTLRDDCRLDLAIGSSNSLMLEWTRHEALSEISSTEMIDLPLSEAQAGIEAEFIADGGNIVDSLVRRLRSQAEQFRRSMFSTVNKLMSSSNLLMLNSKSLTDWLSSFNSLSSLLIARSQSKKETPYERDYFNLRKIIVAATLRSTVYGIDSNDGSILWSLYLGDDVVPLNCLLNGQKVPLYVQRTTAHSRFAPQAVVVVAQKVTNNAIVITFDPASGALIEKKNLMRTIKRAEILPFADPSSHLYRLLLIDYQNKIILHPSGEASLEQQLPIHSFEFDWSGHLEGFLINLTRAELTRTWSTNLGLTSTQKIVAIAAKPPYQRVHSSGRVLGNRSVLYKYSNPNLIAVAAFDATHSTLYVYLIDVVSGYIIYNAKQNKVSGPIHLVHCENWLAYSYWNERGRRMEIAVIEFYEGLDQTDASQDNSLAPLLSTNVEVISQAYIFPQGISAMGVTETEQGLSTRSIIVAMPFGGLYGISKRILDARRPLEMTQELAEEMLLLYRPEIPVAYEDFINYNQSIHAIRAIKTSASGLESTSLMLAYGLDLFFSRLTPSGTFDILKDDFDHLLISFVLVALVAGSLVCKKLGKNNSLNQAWQ